MTINEIVLKIEELSKKHLSKNSSNIFLSVLDDKKEMNLIIHELKLYMDGINCLTDNMKLIHMLGFIPRNGKNMYICTCFLYWYIKSINPSVKLFILPDGSIKGFISSKEKNNKDHIILQAHCDVVSFSDEIHSGVYGKNPCVYFYQNGTDNGLWIDKHNNETVLGADDGKGIAEILSLIHYITNNVFDSNFSWPNFSFLLTAVEEQPFGYSIEKFCKDSKNINLLFPKWFNNKLFINLDSYCGTQIDTYSNQSEKALKLQKSIIDDYREFVEQKLIKVSTQEKAWENPPSEVIWLKKESDKLEWCKDILYISMNADSINPHSNLENIDLICFDKFCNWFNNWILRKKEA